MERVTGRPATADEIAAIRSGRGGTRIDWSAVADGQWWLVHEGARDEAAEGHRRSFGRVKQATRRWARRHGYARELRRRDGGRLIWVRFIEEDAA